MRLRLFMIVGLVLASLITHSTHIGTGDEPHYLAIAHSLAFDWDLDLANNYGAAAPLLIYGVLFFPELISALLCIFLFRRIALDNEISDWQWSMLGAATGFLLLVHIRNIGLSVAFVFLTALTLTRRAEVRKLVRFL